MTDKSRFWYLSGALINEHEYDYCRIPYSFPIKVSIFKSCSLSTFSTPGISPSWLCLIKFCVLSNWEQNFRGNVIFCEENIHAISILFIRYLLVLRVEFYCNLITNITGIDNDAFINFNISHLQNLYLVRIENWMVLIFFSSDIEDGNFGMSVNQFLINSAQFTSIQSGWSSQKVGVRRFLILNFDLTL